MAEIPAPVPAPPAPVPAPVPAAEAVTTETAPAETATTETATTELSKNARKKLLKQQRWEASRDGRKRKRKEKRLEKAAAKRAQRAADPDAAPAKPKTHTLVPVSFIFDCDFEQYMTDNEKISLSSQITRAYAMNRGAPNNARIYVSSWRPGGYIRHRYETLLTGQHLRWTHAHFLADDFQAAGRAASTAMRGDGGGTVVGPLARTDMPTEQEDTGAYTQADLVYLTSDSPHTLTRLEPYTSYVIGGLVDKNREKGLCFRRAEERGIRTAKLPIGEYMVMASRQVLTTNQVVEIMLAWLDTGDWGAAFAQVIPKRKGGQLKGETEAEDEEDNNAEDENGDKDGDENKDEDENDGRNLSM